MFKCVSWDGHARTIEQTVTPSKNDVRVHLKIPPQENPPNMCAPAHTWFRGLAMSGFSVLDTSSFITKAIKYIHIRSKIRHSRPSCYGSPANFVPFLNLSFRELLCEIWKKIFLFQKKRKKEKKSGLKHFFLSSFFSLCQCEKGQTLRDRGWQGVARMDGGSR